MGRKLDDQFWDEMVQAYREVGEHYVTVARRLKCDPKTAKKALEQGLKGLGDGLSIKQILDDEKLAARAQIQQERRKELEAKQKEQKDARDQAVASRKQEGLMVGLGRGMAAQALRGLTQALQSAGDLGARAKRKLDLMIKEDDGGGEPCPACGHPQQIPLHEVLDLLNQMTTAGEKTVRLAHSVMVMERLHLGRPTETIEVVDKTATITSEEAKLRLQAAVDALSGAQRRGLLDTTNPAHPQNGKEKN